MNKKVKKSIIITILLLSLFSVNRYYSQIQTNEAIEWVKNVNGEIIYADYSNEYDFVTTCRRLFSSDKIEGINLSGNINNIKKIELFKNLKSLTIAYTNVTSFESLRKLSKLQELNLVGTKLRKTDLNLLAQLKKLKTLWLSDKSTSIKEVEILRKLLPNCEVIYFQ